MSELPLAAGIVLALAGGVSVGTGACRDFEATAPDDGGASESGFASEGGSGPDAGVGSDATAMPSGQPCNLPPLTTVDQLVSGQSEIVALTADPANVFWATTANGGEIRTRPRVVSSVANSTLVTGVASQNVSDLIMVGTNLTWTSGSTERKLLSFPPGGGAPIDNYDSVNGSTGHLEAYDNDNAIFARTTGLLRCAIGAPGCSAVPVTLDNAMLGTSVFSYTSPFLYFLAPTASSNGVYSCRASSCDDAGAPLADSQGDVTVMASDANAAYIASSTGGTIRRIGRDGTVLVLATGIEPTSMSAMDKNLLMGTAKGLLAVPKTGGCVDTLAPGKYTHVMERGGVAFAVQNAGEILRIPPRVP